MSTWIIVSWVFVAILTIVNVVFFLKLKQASEQMMKMAFPGAKNMNEALSQMQSMTQGMGMGGGRGGSRGPAPGGRGGNPAQQAQLKAAMDMLKNMQQPKGKR